jgi:hypothetical protein
MASGAFGDLLAAFFFVVMRYLHGVGSGDWRALG